MCYPCLYGVPPCAARRRIVLHRVELHVHTHQERLRQQEQPPTKVSGKQRHWDDVWCCLAQLNINISLVSKLVGFVSHVSGVVQPDLELSVGCLSLIESFI